MENNLKNNKQNKQVYFLNISHICYLSIRKVVSLSPQTQAIGGTNIAVRLVGNA